MKIHLGNDEYDVPYFVFLNEDDAAIIAKLADLPMPHRLLPVDERLDEEDDLDDAKLETIAQMIGLQAKINRSEVQILELANTIKPGYWS